MKKLLYLLLILGYLPISLAQKAVCIVPVADLIGSPISTKEKAYTVEQKYRRLPINGDEKLVKRIGQLLFNEIVEIINENKKECCIKVPHHFYCTYDDKTPQTTYWTLKKNLQSLSALQNSNDILPQPLSYTSKKAYGNTITLKQPFHDYKNHRLYSAGTRFLLHPQQQSTSYHYQTITFSPRFKKTVIQIPKKLCIKTKNRTQKQMVDKFIKILRSFAHQQKGSIPYVLGGMSYTAPYKEGFREKTIFQNGQNRNIFQVNKPHNAPHSGFDCASLIYRTAQISGLPFYTKNSSAMKHHLRPLANHESIEDGDIIFIPGHVLVIVDKEKSHIVEARTQSHEYGSIHEINLRFLFKEINKTEDLLQFHFSKTKASRLNRNGKIIARKPITILKLRSIFEN